MKTVNIKGKEYVLVSDRIIYFNENFKNGAIRTELVSAVDASMVVIKATVYPDCSDMNRYFNGYSQATWGDGMVNKTAALENCETSAVGRALGMLGIGVLDSVASADEVRKATTQPPYKPDTLKAITSKVYQPAPATGTLGKNEFTTIEGVKPTLKCMFCGVAINEKVSAYSIEKFKGKEICYDCQQKPSIKNAPSVMRESNDDDYDNSVGN